MKKLLIFPILFLLSCSTEPESKDCAGVWGGSAQLIDCFLGKWTRTFEDNSVGQVQLFFQ